MFLLTPIPIVTWVNKGYKPKNHLRLKVVFFRDFYDFGHGLHSAPQPTPF